MKSFLPMHTLGTVIGCIRTFPVLNAERVALADASDRALRAILWPADLAGVDRATVDGLTETASAQEPARAFAGGGTELRLEYSLLAGKMATTHQGMAVCAMTFKTLCFRQDPDGLHI